MIMLVSLFSALIAAGAFIKIPMIPVPMTLQTLFVFLSILLLPKRCAAASVAVYMILGAIGLPIFTSGGGIGALLGPTGGFIFGFLLAAIICSFIGSGKRESIVWNVVTLLVAEIIISVIGVVWLKWRLSATWAKALSVGFLPFVAGDTVKIIVASLASKILHPETEKLMEKLKAREEE